MEQRNPEYAKPVGSIERDDRKPNQALGSGECEIADEEHSTSVWKSVQEAYATSSGQMIATIKPNLRKRDRVENRLRRSWQELKVALLIWCHLDS